MGHKGNERMEAIKVKRLLVFGCGEMGKRVYKYVSKTRNRVLCYIDNDPQKWGRGIYGKKIISPDQIAELEYEYILIASVYWKEMRQQLLELGVDVKKIRCPLAPMSLERFKREYGEIYNICGKLRFYYDKWYSAEQFRPDFMGIFVNPYFFSRKMLYECIKKYSHYMSGKCMDFGCGTSPYKKLLPVKEYVGVEIETDNKKPDIVYYDGYTLPFEDEKFDSIISSEVFEHVFNIEDIVLELNRVLKPEGIMLLTVPFAYPKHCEPYDYKRYTMEGLKDLLKNAGFEFMESETSSGYWECVAQFQNVYWSEVVRPQTALGKSLKKIKMACNNFKGIVMNFALPHSDKLYLDNVVVVRKSRREIVG